MNLCFVHDYLNQFGGAEKTLQAMHEIWPEAPIYTTLVDWRVVEQLNLPKELIFYPRWLNLPIIGSFYKYFSFCLPLVFESFDLSRYDLVISSSANFAKGIITRSNQVHINYCHTPPRFLYHLPTETNRRQHWFWRPVLALLDFYLRVWDFTAAQRVDFFVANSQNVAGRIKKWYRREAKVIYPPVELASGWREKEAESQTFGDQSPALKIPSEPGSEKKSGFGESALPANYYLVVSRLSAYKNIGLVIRACARLNRPLKVVGAGPEEGRLKKLVKKLGAPVEFTGFVSDQKLAGLYAGCRALIFSGLEEDFGIVPVEAMSFGRPVIALRSGGVAETVEEGKTGIFFDKPAVNSLMDALLRFESLGYFRAEECAKACRQQAQKFSKERFQKEFKKFVEGEIIPFHLIK
ncbi:hypothetical protein B5M47_00020 [candidate division CPR3 bacterium 4484_211]|uniref:Glycosyl transferase family 1 domain-containing protein n=1 Tax=candidate division CPR3 bacterium 4484_211 TaxID=1968527 RepID=A0A1W9NZL0_UNCC3|nr:MAG: hypothetical protein B5M47_00020 [candidate division CPR3 bacterium 4484_211]